MQIKPIININHSKPIASNRKEDIKNLIGQKKVISVASKPISRSYNPSSYKSKVGSKPITTIDKSKHAHEIKGGPVPIKINVKSSVKPTLLKDNRDNKITLAKKPVSKVEPSNKRYNLIKKY